MVLDIGTGDGLFVYRSARANPAKFFIGVDANARPLQKISERIHRKPTKGGAANAMFIQASVEDLPDELNGIAEEVSVHFPWGSLLRVVATGEVTLLRRIRGVCAGNAVLKLTIGIDRQRDSAEIRRLGLQPITEDFVGRELRPLYFEAGFDLTLAGSSGWAGLNTSWAKRLQGTCTRQIVCLIARAIEAGQVS